MPIGLAGESKHLDMVGVVGSSPIAPTKSEAVSPLGKRLLCFLGLIVDLHQTHFRKF